MVNKNKQVPQTIPAIATTEEPLSASPALVAEAATAAAAAEIGFIVGCRIQNALNKIDFILGGCIARFFFSFNKSYSKKFHILIKATFVTVSEVLEASYERFSNVRSNRIPSEFANILMPFSLAETAKRVPSLLKRIRGLGF